MNRFKKLLELWTNLPAETKESVISRWPWLVAFAAGLLAACYFGLCRCGKAKGAEQPASVQADSKWLPWQGNPKYLALWRGGEEVGFWDVEKKTFHPRKPSGNYGPATTPPVAPPGMDWRTEGVQNKDGSPVTSKRQIVLHGAGGTRHLSPEQARLFLSQAKSLPDDSRKVHLTVIGSEDKRKPVLDDLAKSPELVALADRLLVQGYSPEDWPVKDVGFPPGEPTIIIQSRKGGVLHAQYEYRGPAKLAEAIEAACAEAVRRADPDRDPSKDPDLNKPTPSSGGSALIDLASKVPTPAWWLAAGGAAVLILGRGKKNDA
jgi:hypothetical protein